MRIIYRITYETDGRAQKFEKWDRPGVGTDYTISIKENGVEFTAGKIPDGDEAKFHAVFFVRDVYGGVRISTLIELK